MSESFNDNPTKIRVDEGLNKVALANYLSNFLDIDKNSFEILQFPSGFSNLTYLIKSNKNKIDQIKDDYLIERLKKTYPNCLFISVQGTY